jgi:heat-inducible transcriptional repressor
VLLTSRQQVILQRVVESYTRTGQPVSSKALAQLPELSCSASTVRNELARLEELGLLDHPHTSAGRVPTQSGQRFVVDELLAAPRRALAKRPCRLSLVRAELEQAMHSASTALAQMTNLVAVVTAPSPQSAEIRHIEVLALQPTVVAVVIITATGGVSKTLVPFEHPVDQGLVGWAGAYLGERLEGLELGARMVSQRLADPELGAVERAFLDRLAHAFANIPADDQDAVYIEGTAHLFAGNWSVQAREIEVLMTLLERRVALLRMLCAALSEPDVYVRIGRENSEPAMHSWALVANAYGLSHRRLGTVSVIGPICMDYPRAIESVRGLADALSSYIEDAYATS